MRKVIFFLFLPLAALAQIPGYQVFTIKNPGFLAGEKHVFVPDFGSGNSLLNAASYTYNGTTQGMAFVHNTTNFPFERTQAITLQQRFRYDESDALTTVTHFSKTDNLSSNKGFQILRSNNKFRVILFSASGNSLDVEGLAELKRGYWYNLIVTYDGSSSASGVHLYLDNLERPLTVLSNTLTTSIANTRNVGIGMRNPFPGLPFFGKIADTRIFSRVINSLERATLHNDASPMTVATPISNCVFEHWPDRDTWNGTNYTAVDTYGATGNTVSMTIGSRVTEDFNRLSSSTLTYDTQKTGFAAAAILYQGYVWDAARNRAWFTFLQRGGGSGFSSENVVTWYDFSQAKLFGFFPIGWTTLNGNDSHAIASLLLRTDGQILIAHEDLHQSPIWIKKFDPSDNSTTLISSAIGSDLGYPYIYRVGSDIYLFCRWLYTKTVWFKSSDEGQTWTSSPQKMIDINPSITSTASYSGNPGTLPEWLYGLPFQVGNRVYWISVKAAPNTNNFQAVRVMYSDDMVTWTNLAGTFSKNVVTSGYITLSELDTYFQVDQVTLANNASSMVNYCAAAVSPAGTFYWLNRRKENDGYNFCYYDPGTSSIIRKPLYISYVQNNQYGVIEAYDDNTFDLFMLVPDGAVNTIHKYTSTDRGTSWTDTGAFYPSSAVSYNFFYKAKNWYQVPSDKRLLIGNVNTDATWSDVALKLIP